MNRILINDGLHESGKYLLEKAGFQVDTERIEQDELIDRLPDYQGIIVRSATQITTELIEACPDLKFIGRGGVGLDNIDVEAASQHGIAVFNTPAASSTSVAELVFGHILNIARDLHKANRNMPTHGLSQFKKLKKEYAKGIELNGKTIGVIGMGRIGSEVARIALGFGMNVIGYDPFVTEKEITLSINGQLVNTSVQMYSLEDLLSSSDVITVHVPSQDSPIIGLKELERLKSDCILINASRGGVIDEEALLKGVSTSMIRGAGIDVFQNEPRPRVDLLEHPLISLSPHIGASTSGAQEKIAIELSEKIISLLK